jgi:hypothetical protein
MLGKLIALKNLDRGQRCSTCHRLATMGATLPLRSQGVSESLASCDNRDRIAVAEILAEIHDVRNHSFRITSPHGSGTTEPGRMLIEDEQSSKAVRKRSHSLQIAWRIDPRSARIGNRLENDPRKRTVTIHADGSFCKTETVHAAS